MTDNTTNMTKGTPNHSVGRMKRDLFYVSIFALVAVVLYGAQNIFAHFVPITSKIYLNAIQILFPFLGAIIAKYFFLKTEKRGMVKREASRLALKFYGVIVFMHLVVGGAVFFWGAMGGSTSVNLEAFMLLMPLLLVIIIAYLVLSIFQFIAIYLGVKLLGLNKNKSTKTVFEQIEGDEPSVNPATVAPATTAISEDDWKTADDDWKPVDDRGGFAIREEKAPWLKYAVGILALLLIGGGAIWLASKVVIADKVPTIERADNAKDKPIDGEAPQAPKSEDDLAWVKALEIDTVEGYRGYIADFPNGRHVEDAQRLINEFDEEAWKLADERDTIDGYEDYLESWPEGLHVTEARERIARIKAEEEARRKNAEEAARQEAAAWKTAAEANTIPSYEGYLSKFPTGKNAPEAQTRIERLRAEEARAQASAADEAAWQAANATGTADAYQQYLTSFPQGAHVPEAIAKLEDLRPGPGKTFKDCATCPTMVSLPAGTAELGAQASDGKAKPNEKPARPVTFSNLFAIGVTEVTFAEYGACVAAGGCKSMPSDNGWGQGSRPVINVSWSDAVAYAQWLSNTTGKSYALPSDAQWEYAARGGKTDALIGGSPQAICAFANGASKESGLPWANEACTDLAADRTLPVGSLSKNGFGTADMIGNVAEWTMDCNTLNLRDAPVDGSPDARGSCSQRIVRGGSWFSGPDDLRYSARAVQRRGDTNDFTGFRVVRN